MEVSPLTLADVSENTLLRLSREVARNIHPLENILERFGISSDLWLSISSNPRFKLFLQQEVELWEGVPNTAERVKLKSLAMIEESLPEFYERAHDPGETLSSKVELLKTIGRFAGVGVGSVEASVGEKLSVTINLGADTQLKFDKSTTPTIDVTPHE